MAYTYVLKDSFNNLTEDRDKSDDGNMEVLEQKNSKGSDSLRHLLP